jgi:hypothetical protein
VILAELVAALEHRARDAERVQASAPVAAVLRDVVTQLQAVDGAPEDRDRLLTVAEAAAIMGVTPGWIYKHSKALPFARHISRKCLRLSDKGLRKWLANRP